MAHASISVSARAFGNRTRRSFVVGGAATLGVLAARFRGEAAETLSIGTTGRTSNDWPLYCGDKLGMFAKAGIQLDIVDAGSPVGATQQLIGGSIQIGAVTSTQTVQAVQSGVPIVSVIQCTNKPPYLLLGRKGLTSVEQLKGKTIIVSSPNAITRVFGDTILAAHGLKPDDYQYTYAGATNERYAALLSGGVDAALLLPPFSFRAAAQGYPILDEIGKYYPRLPFDTYAVNVAWGPSHRPLIVNFAKTLILATRWLYQPRNRTQAQQILVDVTGASPDDATKTYDLLVRKTHDFVTSTSTPEDFKSVIDVLVKLNQVKPPLPPPQKFYDNSYLIEASRLANRA